MKWIIIAGTVVVGLVLLAAIGLAYPGFGPYGGCHGRGYSGGYGYQYAPGMMQIIATGTYADLEALREKAGVNIMPWVNEESFKLMQNHYNTQWRYGMIGWR